MEEKIRQCTSFSEVSRALGYAFYNGRVKREIISKCFLYNIDIEKQIEDYRKRKVYCAKCGKEIIGKGRFRKKFCSKSCAVSYNNKLRGPVSQEQKEKVSKVLKEKYKNKETRGHKKIEKECPVCHKKFLGCEKQIYCSPQCAHKSEAVKDKIRQKQLEKIKNGTHSGWKCRNITSYPERFFETVLENNKINYEREDFSTKKYFLDFLILKGNKKIDLEIDGKQHLYEDRKTHDIERDEYLTNNGFIVYRIPWNGINSERGKQKMKEKINKFLEFYNNIQ